MNVILISGSSRINSNTEYLLRALSSQIKGELIKLSDYNIDFCHACIDCRGKGKCIINDDMQKKIIPKVLNSNIIVLGSPIYFNNVTSLMKSFMDRTYCLMGLLKNKIGGAVIVGRGYGAESVITAINAFFLKHQMIPANRGVLGHAFYMGEIENDINAIEETQKLGERLIELGEKFGIYND